MSDYPLDPHRPPTVKLSRDEWVNLVTTAVMEIGEEPIREAARLALGPERADKLIEDKEGPRLSKRDNHAIIRAVYPLVPGKAEADPSKATREDKIEWLIDKAAPCFIDENRFFEVLSYVRHRVEEFEAAGGSIDHYPDPPPAPGEVNPADYRGGFLWKPVADSGGKLVVLLPARATGHTAKDTALWHDNKRLEGGAWGGIGNGDREHYRYSKQGSAYPAGVEVRATVRGHVLAWRVDAPGKRNDGNITPRIVE